MESTGNYFFLLFWGQLDKVNSITGYPDSQLWVFLRMFHCIQQGLPVQHVHVQVMGILDKITVKNRDQITDLILLIPAKGIRHDGEGIGNTILAIIIWQLGYRV